MPLREALFWVGLTVFGTGLYFVVADETKTAWSISMVVLGLLGVGYAIYSHHHPALPKIPTWAYFFLLTCLALGFAYYDSNRQAPPTVGQLLVPPIITAENLEANVRQWLDDFHLTVKKRDEPEDFFSFDIMGPENGMTLRHAKRLDKYLVLGAVVSLGGELVNEYKNLSDEQKSELGNNLRLELARAKLSFQYQLPKQILIENAIPITKSLTEYDLIKSISEFDDAILLVKTSIDVNLTKIGKERTKK